MGCRVALGDVCSFHRGASVPRARMYNEGDYLYIHYGDLYRGFSLRIDVEDPAKHIPYILRDEQIKDNQRLKDQDIVYVLTSETVDDLGHAFLFNNPIDKPAVSGTETTIVRVERRDLVVPAYLNYLMGSPRFVAELRQYTRGMKVFRVHPGDVARIEVDLPPIETQHQVVAVLDAIYAKQQVNTKLNGYLAEQCEGIVEHQTGDVVALASLCGLASERVDCREADIATYVSTESLLPAKMGKQTASTLPQAGKVAVYKAGDTLVSNIRPYFKKIWYADRSGTCSGDVLVFRANQPEHAGYLYSCLRQDRFFDYVMKGAKGTKMPRGDKKQMLTYEIVNSPSAAAIGAIQTALEQISIANKENDSLAALRDALLPKLMSGEIDVSKVDLTQLNSHLSKCSSGSCCILPVMVIISRREHRPFHASRSGAHAVSVSPVSRMRIA